MWGAGNYLAVAENRGGREACVERAEIAPDMDMLDVACGTGNATIPLRERAPAPLASTCFDRVISTFGHMFAPDYARTAAEMKRVLRPGGGSACAAGAPTATGACSARSRPWSHRLRAPRRSWLWGTEEHVRELLGEAELERREIEWRDPSVEGYADFMLESFGPLLNAREVLGERGGELRPAFLSFLSR